jgi:hypothetical protein
MKKVLLIALLFTSCGNFKNQWMLQSYDSAKGYTFVKDGIAYHAHCFAVGRPMLPNNVPDTNPDAMPPDAPIGGESGCADILPYLGKSVPLRQDGEILLFTEPQSQNFKLEFEVKDAK